MFEFRDNFAPLVCALAIAAGPACDKDDAEDETPSKQTAHRTDECAGDGGCPTRQQDAHAKRMVRPESRQYEKSADHYEKSCNRGNLTGCARLGELYADGRGVERDWARAETLLRKTCGESVTAGCFRLGVMYDRGNGVERDQKKGRRPVRSRLLRPRADRLLQSRQYVRQRRRRRPELRTRPQIVP